MIIIWKVLQPCFIFMKEIVVSSSGSHRKWDYLASLYIKWPKCQFQKRNRVGYQYSKWSMLWVLKNQKIRLKSGHLVTDQINTWTKLGFSVALFQVEVSHLVKIICGLVFSGHIWLHLFIHMYGLFNSLTYKPDTNWSALTKNLGTWSLNTSALTLK